MNDRLVEAFRSGLELDSNYEVTNLTYRSIPEWDSIGHMALIATIESDFDIEFSPEEILDLSSFAVALDILQRKTS
jgi:acyl carrier protein